MPYLSSSPHRSDEAAVSASARWHLAVRFGSPQTPGRSSRFGGKQPRGAGYAVGAYIPMLIPPRISETFERFCWRLGPSARGRGGRGGGMKGREGKKSPYLPPAAEPKPPASPDRGQNRGGRPRPYRVSPLSLWSLRALPFRAARAKNRKPRRFPGCTYALFELPLKYSRGNTPVKIDCTPRNICEQSRALSPQSQRVSSGWQLAGLLNTAWPPPGAGRLSISLGKVLLYLPESCLIAARNCLIAA
ncbi:hypothetical protein SKAU_G00128480 [Synaphobranchus kaupii]|uniref:Uncharacterized protein n=1 Tax=Synaphobranchus kaupii TaxID=118154 RepID=A0A9Q1FQX3_SYNKA|nr:hypothetical protein SKAU_G00128480 [Synaphobranchus kaupii]